VNEQTIYDWCKRLVNSMVYWDAHPEDAYGDAEQEYCEDALYDLLKERQRD
jgi:hypothetical protein